MIHPILAYGDPILKLKASNISIDETGNLGPLIKDLWETMYNANGVGIAAPQIGISKAIFVVDFSFFKGIVLTGRLINWRYGLILWVAFPGSLF